MSLPLQIIEIGPNDHRLGLEVSVGGGPPALLLFDTGSSGCFVGEAFVGATTPSHRHFHIEYGSGQSYKGSIFSGEIELAPGASAVPVVATDVECGAITDATPALPLPGGLDGTLGMSLERGSEKQGDLYSLIAQLPGNLSSGFIVSAGGNPPTLTIGLTDAERATFATRRLSPQKPARYPNGVRAWNDKATKIRVRVDDFATVLPTVFDTGAVNTELIGVPGVPRRLLVDPTAHATSIVPSVPARFDIPGTPWTFITGDTANDDTILHLPLDGGGSRRLNTGLGIYFVYDVMFDIAGGRIGFRLAQ